ncbi:MAG: flagellar biosynthesis anti-sigma factor FlgM [Planctomycetota bacterium]
MADISSVNNSGNGPYRIGNAERAVPSQADPGRVESPRREREADSVSFSEAARSASKIDSPEVRDELVARVRAALEGGTYVSDEKLDAAVETMIDEILRG